MSIQKAPAAPVDTTPLYVDDKEIAALLGLKVSEWRANAMILERRGLPAGDPLFSGRRYWPAVKAFLDRRYGLEAPSPLKPDGVENFDGI